MKTYLLIIVSLITLASCTKEKTHSPFVTTWKTTVDNEDITIYTSPEITAYNYHIDWGDGIIEQDLKGDATHKYATRGIYTVKITGDFPAIYSGGEGEKRKENAAKLQTITQWGSIKWESMRSAFNNCNNVTYTAKDVPNLASVTDMSEMFAGAIAFNGDIGNWDVSKVRDMSYMFLLAKKFNSDIGSWDVSSVTTMNSMFAGAKLFNQDIGDWDVSKVTDMSRMFFGMYHLDKVHYDNGSYFNQDIVYGDESNIRDIGHMLFSSKDFKNYRLCSIKQLFLIKILVVGM